MIDINELSYPTNTKSNFAEIIANKKEFKRSMHDDIDYDKFTFEELSNSMCEKKDFRITKNQLFVKTFLSPNTPYNSILLYHGVGVGKTCAAINIAEQFIPLFKIKNPQSKCLVLLPTNLKDNFRKQLFDIENLNQCTSEKYLNQIKNKKILSKDSLQNQANKLINDNYEFMGFIEFSKSIKSVLDKSKEDTFIKYVKRNYSNRVIIIDEVHNVRAEDESTDKLAPKMILKVLQHADNVKLIMLSATPMFNDSTEIVWILNYILANEKKQLIDVNDIFDNNGNLKPNAKEIIIKASNGYISYMRGENPFTFPLKLLNIEDKTVIPKFDIYGKKITKTKLLSRRFANTITTSTMSKFQTSVYLKQLHNVRNKESYEEDQDTNSIYEGSGETNYNVSNMIQISNIVFPCGEFSKNGFYKTFNSVGKSGWKYKLSYKEEYLNCLNSKNLKKYSSKLNDIVNKILSSTGIVYVYSNYLYSSLLPLAIALEHVGFKRSNGSNIVQNIKATDNGLRYSILTRNNELYTDIDSEVSKITSPENKNGSKIKVILGTSVTTEGINFKNIRQIHIIEPWFHLNKIEQVIGRAIRMCSHIDLPIPQRNVTIFKHASTYDHVNESVDMRIYRVAENKQNNISAIESILISNSIDCNLNFKALKYDTKYKIDLITSQNSNIYNYKIADDINDKHSKLKCLHTIDENKEENSLTFNKYFYEDDIIRYIKLIENLFQTKNVYSFNEIKNIIATDNDIISFALDDMITKKISITVNNVNGYLVYFGNLYMFQPNHIKNDRLIQDSRNKDYVDIKRNIINNVVVNTVDKNDKILNSVINEANELRNSMSRFVIYDENIYIDYVIDRLTDENLIKLITSHIDIMKKEEMNDLIYKSLYEKGSLLRNGNVIYVNIDDKNIIKIGEKNKISTGNNLDLIEYKNLNKPRIRKTNILGYVEKNKNDILQFKIKNDGIKSNGTVCGTGKMKREEYINMIISIDNNINIKGKYSNKDLCKLLELVLRNDNKRFERN